MPESPSSSSTAPPSKTENSKRPRWTAGAVVAIIVGAAVAVYVANRPEPVPPKLDGPVLVPVFDHLEAEEYTANRSLAGRYLPGDVVQLKEPDPTAPEGAGRILRSPILALRAELCFPSLEAVPAPFPLPDDSVSSEASFGLEGARIAEVVPGLSINDSAVASYALSFRTPRVLALPKLEMSGNFAPACVESLKRADALGDRIEWFEAVQAVVVAEGFRLEVNWKADSAASAQAVVKQKAEAALQSAAPATPTLHGQDSPGAMTPESLVAGSVELESSDERRTVWAVDAQVVIGFRTRPLEPIDPTPVDAGDGGAGGGSGGSGGSDDPGGFGGSGGLGVNDPFGGQIAVRSLPADGGPGRFVPLEHVFETGERFRFELETNRPARVYLFHQAPTGERQRIWPAAGDEANLVQPGERFAVPAEGAAFEMRDETGMESFVVALADVEAPALESALPRLFQAQAVRPETARPGAAPSELQLRTETIGNLAVRGLDGALTRGVTTVDDGRPVLRFAPARDGGYLAAATLRLRHGDGSGDRGGTRPGPSRRD